MGDSLWTVKPFCSVTNRPGQLSPVSPAWIGTMNTAMVTSTTKEEKKRVL